MPADSNGLPRRGAHSGRTLAATGAVIVVLDALLAIVGHASAGLGACALLLAPGLALAALLPASVRREPVALACAVPVLGFAASSVALITLTRVGVPLTGVSSRIALAALAGVGLAWLPLRDPIGRLRAVELVLPAVAVTGGIVLQARVLHGFPVPGNDWAKYLLYADEIRRHGQMLIDNPYWMLGVPFREDPGVPSVYGAFLVMSGASTAVLAHGIWVFAVIGIGAIYAWVRAVWEPVAGGLAALFYAVVPMNQDILGWHGLANVAALALLPLVLLYATELLRGRLGRREAAGFAVLLLALAAAHRLSASVTVLALALAAAVALIAGPRRAILRAVVAVGAFCVVLGWGVISHLVAVNRTFGGTQGYEAYLSSKVDLDLVALDLTKVFSVAAAVAVLWALWRLRRHPTLGVPLAYLAVTVALTYSWLVHLPLSYLRMAYYLPLVLAPLVGVALADRAKNEDVAQRKQRSARRRSAVGVVAGTTLAAVVAVMAWNRAGDVRAFYRFADPASLRGLDTVAAQLRPGEVVVTDRCWSFLSTWLLHTRTLPALAPEDIQPKAELPIARRAQSVLDGNPSGVAYARRLGVRFLLVDPTCVNPQGEPMPSPLLGEPVYASRRLVVLEVPPDPRTIVRTDG